MTMQHSSQPWWTTDRYDDDTALPSSFTDWQGPQGVALVKTWPSGKTDQGWGLQPPPGSTEGFIPRYNRGEFNSRRVIYGFKLEKWTFAIVMRSLRMVCVDIDGKNGGDKGAQLLGPLPPTLAETSKSGNGYHLFYSLEEDWDFSRGYATLGDRIGIEVGVDIRATGCVYHHLQQRWNRREIAPLPSYLQELLVSREQKVTAAAERITAIIQNNDDLEVLMLHDEILSDLAKPIPAGKRNITLFAIGNKMRQAGIESWDTKLSARADEVGLGPDETLKLVQNIERYGS